MSNLKLSIRDEVAIVTFDAENSKVNTLTEVMMKELSEALETVGQKTDVKALFFQSAKPRIFIAGADIKEIENIRGASDGEAKSKAGQGVLNLIEDLPIPSVALINGAALGGGLELALACTYRFASFAKEVRIGLPEVMLGIIPGFGGTFRLPRRVGLQQGIQLIVQGKALDANRAYRAGILDGLAAENLLFDTALGFLKKNGFKKGAGRRRRKTLAERLLENRVLGHPLVRFFARQSVLKITRGHYPAPLKAIDIVLKNYRSPRAQALKRESGAFGELLQQGQYKELIGIFYLTERYKKEKWTDAEETSIQKCGVLGAGIMGGGIAQLVSSLNIPVRLKDIDASALLLGLQSAKKLYADAVRKKRMNKAEAETQLGFILPTLEYSGFKRCDLVIEAVLEDMQIKKKVFMELERATSPHTILASNTSSLSVSQMGEALKDPSRVVGMHFFNPVHRMPLVEVIRGEKTSPETIATIVEFSRKLRKTPVVVKDTRGFLVNRLLLPYLNEAGFLFEEGVPLDRIDRMLTRFGMPMGAFILMDEIGLDVCHKVAHILEEAFGERMQPCSILSKMNEKKWVGKKAGRGFYIHKGKKRIPNPEIRQWVVADSPAKSEKDIVSRCLGVMINEAALCLEEGVCREAADIDIGMIMGTGFPPFRGGLMRYADSLGAAEIASDLEKFYQSSGSSRFKTAASILNMKKGAKKFYPE